MVSSKKRAVGLLVVNLSAAIGIIFAAVVLSVGVNNPITAVVNFGLLLLNLALAYSNYMDGVS